jgi:hypothetical protein
MEEKFIVMSPCYEILRYGHDKIKRDVEDAHAVGKLSKFVFGINDLIDPEKPPTPDNFKFEVCQAEVADVVIFVDGKEPIIQNDFCEWGRRKKRVKG